MKSASGSTSIILANSFALSMKLFIFSSEILLKCFVITASISITSMILIPNYSNFSVATLILYMVFLNKDLANDKLEAWSPFQKAASLCLRLRIGVPYPFCFLKGWNYCLVISACMVSALTVYRVHDKFLRLRLFSI